MASNPSAVLDSAGSTQKDDGPSNATGSKSNDRSNVLQSTEPLKKKNRRAGRKKRQRKMSFAAPPEDVESGSGLPAAGTSSVGDGFYMRGRNLSNTSIDSEALLDHREHRYPRPRRPSTLASPFQMPGSNSRLRSIRGGHVDDDADGSVENERAPLLSESQRQGIEHDYGSHQSRSRDPRTQNDRARRGSSRSSRKRGMLGPPTPSERYNVNYPPSVPGSPPFGSNSRPDWDFGDIMMRDEFAEDASRADSMLEAETNTILGGTPFERRHTIALPAAEEDVCFPQEVMSEIADDETRRMPDSQNYRARRRRRGKWPDLAVLEEWSAFEKEGRSEERRMKKITEPELVNGRLRPSHRGWYRVDEDIPYRFTYFNENLESTIHSQTISELVQPDSSFKELFAPEPPVLSDSSDDEIEDGGPVMQPSNSQKRGETSIRGLSRQPSMMTTATTSEEVADRGWSPKRVPSGPRSDSKHSSGEPTPVIGPRSSAAAVKIPESQQSKPVRYGERPVWWLDVLSPTEAEMRVISKAFGIHPLTAEDIMLQEQREKVELFRNYYFVNYMSFDQDTDPADTRLDPLNIYVVVFRDGVVSFHFNQTPHPANVRRRIRQLKDYMVMSADWISYAIIDDITDAFQPLIHKIEEEVDDIDDSILKLHWTSDPASPDYKSNDLGEKNTIATEGGADGRDMLRRVGDSRKRVMEMFRLLGTKADVIKGFAKRCNEHWQVAPRSDIGMYLGDIQDHIVTMVGNLNHYELMLARCHANYLAQINIRMNERQEQTADVLGKLTVLGTIVLPMNIITGLWGMNVWVPGQEFEGNLTWFFGITGGLFVFGLACYITAKRVYQIV